MPVYTFLDTEQDREFDVTMPWQDYEQYLENNPHIQRIFKPVASADPIRLDAARGKPDSGFRDQLKHIKSKHRGSTINTW